MLSSLPRSFPGCTLHPSHLAALLSLPFYWKFCLLFLFFSPFLKKLSRGTSLIDVDPLVAQSKKETKNKQQQKSQKLYFDILLGITTPLSQSDIWFCSPDTLQFCLLTGGKTAEGFQRNICRVLTTLGWADAQAKRKKNLTDHSLLLCSQVCVCLCTCVRVHAYACERVCRSQPLALSLTIRSVWSVRQT